MKLTPLGRLAVYAMLMPFIGLMCWMFYAMTLILGFENLLLALGVLIAIVLFFTGIQILQKDKETIGPS